MTKKLAAEIQAWANRNAHLVVDVWRKGPSCDCHTDDERLKLLIETALTEALFNVRKEIEAKR